MNIIQMLLERIDEYSGKGTAEVFYHRFLAGQYTQELKKPLLLGQAGIQKQKHNLANLPYQAIQSLSINNYSNEKQEIILSENILSQCDNLSTAFDRFVSMSAHSNPLGDFRQMVDFYHSEYCTSRYLFFHGDGNCVTLGVLLFSFLQHFLNIDIDLHYSCGSAREFMHVYAVKKLSQNDVQYLDPDQKITCDYHELDQYYSPGLIYQLLSAAGFYHFDQIDLTARAKLFLPMTEQLMDEYRVLPGPIIYQQFPGNGNFARLFAKARTDINQVLDVTANDYPWKQAYQEIGRCYYDTTLPFLSQLKQDITLAIPSQGCLEIGVQQDNEIQELIDFCMIFFGRVPLKLTVQLAPNRLEALNLPTVPWMILFDRVCDTVTINQQVYPLSITSCQRYCYLGMPQLQAAARQTQLGQYCYNIAAAQKTTVMAVLPLNALAFNADCIRLSTEADAPIGVSYRERIL